MSQIGDRRQHCRGSGVEQVPAVRVLCAQLGQRERGKTGDPVWPAFQNAVHRTGGAERLNRLHLQLQLELFNLSCAPGWSCYEFGVGT